MELQRYTTYLRPEQVKWVKIQAVNDGVHDYDIMQEAIDLFFDAPRGITESTKPRMADSTAANPRKK